jgi:hypothetical protein
MLSLSSSGISLKTGASFTVESQLFSVNTDGTMTCTSGQIGAWTITSDGI